MSAERLPVFVAEFTVAIEKAIREVQKGRTEGCYVTEVRFGLEGEDLPVRLVPDDFEGYDLVVGQDGAA